jgi:hypothetical protein
MASGDSVCPTNIVAAAHRDSTVRVPMTQRSAPDDLHTHCMIEVIEDAHQRREEDDYRQTCTQN